MTLPFPSTRATGRDPARVGVRPVVVLLVVLGQARAEDVGPAGGERFRLAVQVNPAFNINNQKLPDSFTQMGMQGKVPEQAALNARNGAAKTRTDLAKDVGKAFVGYTADGAELAGAAAPNGLTMGLRGEYDVHQRLFLRTGFDYAVVTRGTNRYFTEKTVTLGPDARTAQGSWSLRNEYALELKASLWEVPLLLGIHALRTRDSRVYLAGGVALVGFRTETNMTLRNSGTYTKVVKAAMETEMGAGTAGKVQGALGEGQADSMFESVHNRFSGTALGFPWVVGGAVRLYRALSLAAEVRFLYAGARSFENEGTARQSLYANDGLPTQSLFVGPPTRPKQSSDAAYTTGDTTNWKMDVGYTRFQFGIQLPF